jgi:hypothetical protein
MATILITNAAHAPDPIAARFNAAGHLVLIAHDGDHAWQLMQQFHVDLLITDRHLTLVQRLGTHPNYADLPIVVACHAESPASAVAWDTDTYDLLPATIRALIAGLDHPAATAEAL